jgi:hypothetical protein
MSASSSCSAFPLVPTRSRSFLLLPLLVALVLGGCQCPQRMLEGNADVEIDIPSSDITRILSVTDHLMQKNGYQAVTDAANQEVPFVVADLTCRTNRVLCFSNLDRDRVWIIAQPIGYGWHLYCLPEPVGYDTSFARHRFERILQSVQQECS